METVEKTSDIEKIAEYFFPTNGRLAGISNSDLQELRLKTLKHVDEPNDAYP